MFFLANFLHLIHLFLLLRLFILFIGSVANKNHDWDCIPKDDVSILGSSFIGVVVHLFGDGRFQDFEIQSLVFADA